MGAQGGRLLRAWWRLGRMEGEAATPHCRGGQARDR